MPPVDDEQCVRAYLNGDLDAFETIYARYRDRLYGYVMRNSQSTDVAEELFQEIWLKVLVNLDRYVSRGKFRSWLFVCAHNVIVDQYRKRIDEPTEPAELEKQATSTDVTLLDVNERMTAALNSLPLEQRQAFYLREELDCSLKDIAEIQHCGVEAAKSRLRYAYSKLRAQLENSED